MAGVSQSCKGRSVDGRWEVSSRWSSDRHVKRTTYVGSAGERGVVLHQEGMQSHRESM